VASGFRFDFDNAESRRGRAGVRVGFGGALGAYIDAKVLHEFRGDNETVLDSGGFDLALLDESRGTWFRGEIGLAGSPGEGGGFAALWGEAGDVEGYGIRLGFRF